MIQNLWCCLVPELDNIFDWIDSADRTLRAFELGTFDPNLLPIIFQELFKGWDRLTLAYISDVIGLSTTFANDFLSALCLDRRVPSYL